ncbi:MAG: lipopolysaccharide heptosyltransferase II [Elusimicrobiaceae bacterium]|uniref:lipopolysaccharide heptosyltransferase II n=1 Tax=Candidatus Avelusimicrobium gallicola TaxID=2562704 RepID=A0A928DP10_9BACT|nr:lipopolysaccharide heptosyltransferase II [Elusimicrobium sp.]MBQ9971551.1 lipopolysaccharide heptosyltransferase II [Elusimicrobiaceae bacterium]
MNKNKPNILVIRLSSLGDIVLSSPVYKNIKAAWPDARITLLVKPQFAQALAGHPDIDEIMVAKKSLFANIRQIRAGHFTHLLDLHVTLKTMLMSFFSKISNRIRYDKNSIARRMFVRFHKTSPVLERHTLDKYLEALKLWNIEIKYREPKLGDWAYKNAEVNGKKVRKIAIFQTSFIGDSVLTTPLVKKTAKLFPDSKIVVITRPQTDEIFRPMKEVSEVILNDKKGWNKLAGIWKTAQAIKKAGVDIILVPHRSFRSALIAWLSGVPVRIGFTSSEGWFLYTKTVPFSWMIHDAERNLSLLQGIVKEKFTAEKLNMRYTPSAEENVARLMKDFNLEGKTLVGIHAGSAWPTKCWPMDYFVKLISRLQTEMGVKVVLVGGGKKDADLGEKICQLSEGHAANLCGKTSLSDLMALMEHFKLFITNDSGPMHIATAFDVPTLAIFGPTTRELGFFPYGEGHRVLEVENLPCRPCALHGGKKCPLGHFKCMRDILPERAFENAKEMLEKQGITAK